MKIMAQGIKKEILHNVEDRRRDWFESWEVRPLEFKELNGTFIGRDVIYRSHNKAEAGTLTSWRQGIVFVRYSKGDTAAGAKIEDLVLGIRPLDGPGS